MDFIMNLPPSTNNNDIVYCHILVIVNCLLKMQVFIPLSSLTVNTVVRVLLQYVWNPVN